MPPGADAVVMQEDTKVISEGSVLVMECVRPFEYVRFRGEDIQAGKQVIDKGKRLTPFDSVSYTHLTLPTTPYV